MFHTKRHRNHRVSLLALAMVSTSLVLASCGTTAPTTSKKAASPLSYLVPKSLRQAGVITFGADFTVSPLQYFTGQGKKAGIDVALCDSVAQHLGLKAKWVNLSFDGLIEAALGNRFDAVCTEMFIKPARAAVLDFVPYMTTGQGIATATGNPDHITGLASLCGLNGSVQLGAAEQVTMEAQSAACVKDGKAPINIATFTYTTDAVDQLLNGRAAFWMADDPQIAYYAKLDPKKFAYPVSGIDTTADGLGVSPSNYQLTAALTAALYAMKADGSYKRIMTQWGIGSDQLSYF